MENRVSMIWTKLGISVGVAGAYCIIAGHFLVMFPELDLWREIIAGVLGGIGIVVLALGLRGAKRRKAAAVADEPASLGLDARYWGIMIIAMGGIALFIQPLFRFGEKPVVVAAKTPPPKPAPEPPPPPPPPEPVTNAPFVFPKVKLQGVIVRGAQSAVIIQGRSFSTGDLIEGARIKDIRANGIWLEHQEESLWVKLDAN
jgi:hypothetical protein